MIVAATTLKGGIEDTITPQFGRAATFTIVEISGEEIVNSRVIENAAASRPSGAGIAASQTLIDSGVEILLTGNVGPKAMNVLRSAGIRIYRADGMTVKKAVERLLNGDLEEIVSPGGFGGKMGRGRGSGAGGGRSGRGRGGGGRR